MGYTVNQEMWKEIFAMPTDIADNQLKLCSSGALKVLILIFRNGGKISEEEISRKLNMKISDVEDALEYWKEQGILNGGADSQTKIKTSSDSVEIRHDRNEVETEIKKKALKPLIAPIKKPTVKEIETIGKQAEVQQLLSEAEAILGKTFTSADTSTVIWLYSWAGMSAEVLLTVIAYCKSIGKTGMNYIQTTAVSWINEGIDNVEKAEEYIEKRYGQDEFEKRIRRIFGIWGRSFTENEKKKLDIWKNYDFDDEMYKEAYDRTVDATGKVSFGYISSILANWYKKGIRSKELAEKEDEEIKKERGAEQSYDIDNIDSIISDRNKKISMEG